jgi:DNA invertase Pin-like site-specific DNA recombinase
MPLPTLEIIYARQSIEKKDSISIQTQIDLCEREVSGLGEVKVFSDKGFTGKNMNRPEFRKMMELIESGRVSRLIVYRLDRISRSVLNFANFIETLEEYGVSFVSVNEKFDTSAPLGRAMLYIVMVFAQLERETIAERVRDNYYARGKNGVWLGGPAPFGFVIIRADAGGRKVSALAPNADLELVRRIFDMYASSGMSLGAIAKELRGDVGGMWNNVKLARILHNPAYVRANADVYIYYKSKKCIIVNQVDDFDGVHGCGLYGKRDRGANKYRLTPDHVLAVAIHEGAIDSTIWLRCQAKLDGNMQIKNSGKGRHTWLTGYSKCGYCGYGMVARRFKEYQYLHCSGRQATNNCADKLATHHVKDVEAVVLAELREYVTRMQSAPPRDENPADSQEANRLKMELVKIEDEVDGILSRLSEANATLIEYINRRVVDLDARRTVLMERLNVLATAEKTPAQVPIVDWDNIDADVVKEIMRLFVNKVMIYNDRIEVVWKY